MFARKTPRKEQVLHERTAPQSSLKILSFPRKGTINKKLPYPIFGVTDN